MSKKNKENLQKETWEKYQNSSEEEKEKRQKKAQDKYKNRSENEKEKKRQYHQEQNKNLPEEGKQKNVKCMSNYLTHKNNFYKVVWKLRIPTNFTKFRISKYI